MIELLKRTSCFQEPDLHTALNMLITDHSSWFLRQQPCPSQPPSAAPLQGHVEVFLSQDPVLVGIPSVGRVAGPPQAGPGARSGLAGGQGCVCSTSECHPSLLQVSSELSTRT